MRIFLLLVTLSLISFSQARADVKASIQLPKELKCNLSKDNEITLKDGINYDLIIGSDCSATAKALLK